MAGKFPEIGTRFGKLTVVAQAGCVKGYSYSKCVCDCGTKVTKMNAQLRCGDVTSCGCYRRYIIGIKNRKPFGVAAINTALRSIKKSAKIRNLEFMLSDAEAIELMKKPCFWCGVYLGNKGSQTRTINGNPGYNGLDRIDNNKGYIKDNVVPCCGRCNKARHTQSMSEFLLMCKAVYEKHKNVFPK